MKKTATAALLGLASLVAVGSLAPAAGAQNQQPVGCVPASNVQIVNDDSGSMSGTDSGKLRVDASDLLLQGIVGKTFSGVEFGSTAAPYTGPVLVSDAAKATQLANIIRNSTNADGAAGGGSGTEYGAAFAAANALDPKVNARIFLTDGEPNDSTYQNTLPTPRTYVLGFGTSGLSPEGTARLQKIATDTGGTYFPTDATNLTSNMATILTAINCEAPKSKFVDQFTTQGQTIGHVAPVTRGKTAIIRITWPNAFSKFTVTNRNISITQKGKKVNIARKVKAKKLKVTRQLGSTFEQISLRGIKGSNLKFRITATQLAGPTSATTQVTTK